MILPSLICSAFVNLNSNSNHSHSQGLLSNDNERMKNKVAAALNRLILEIGKTLPNPERIDKFLIKIFLNDFLPKAISVNEHSRSFFILLNILMQKVK